MTSRRANALTLQRVPALDAGLTARLRAVALRLRWFAVIDGFTWLVGFLLLAFFAQFGVDYSLRGVRWSIRAALMGAIALTAAWALWRRILVPLGKRVGPAEIAALVERRFPQLSSVLISAVRFASGEVGEPESNSPDLVRSVIARAGREASGLEILSVLDPRPLRVSLAKLTAAGVFVAALVLAAPETSALWFSRNILLEEVPWPKRTELVVDWKGNELVAARGDDVVIEAHANGVQPREVQIIFETAGGQRGRETMVMVGAAGAHHYRHTFKAAREDLTFHLRGGDDQTGDYRVRLLTRPHVTSSEMFLVPPTYSGLPTLALGNEQRAAEVLPGTQVTITVSTNKPVAQGWLVTGEEKVNVGTSKRHNVEMRQEAGGKRQETGRSDDATERRNGEGVKSQAGSDESVDSAERDVGRAQVDGASRLTATFVATKSQLCHFGLVDEIGLEDKLPARFAIRVVKDEPPQVRLLLAGVGEMITPEAVLPLAVEAQDKYGLATLELAVRVLREGAGERLIDLPGFEAGALNYATTLHWPVAAAAVTPGDRVTLIVRAADFDDVSGPNLAQSAEHSLRVVTRDELLAELGHREQDFRLRFDALVEAQEELRGALLSVQDRFGRAEPGERDGTYATQRGSSLLVEELAPLERRQRNLASSVNVLRQQFEQILAILRINGLDTIEETERLEAGIIEPLATLTRREMTDAADTMRRWSREGTPSIGQEADRQQEQVLAVMRRVLAHMIQWEGYHEVVNMLRDIVRLQRELGDEVEQAAIEEAEGVFED